MNARILLLLALLLALLLSGCGKSEDAASTAPAEAMDMEYAVEWDSSSEAGAAADEAMPALMEEEAEALDQNVALARTAPPVTAEPDSAPMALEEAKRMAPAEKEVATKALSRARLAAERPAPTTAAPKSAPASPAAPVPAQKPASRMVRRPAAEASAPVGGVAREMLRKEARPDTARFRAKKLSELALTEEKRRSVSRDQGRTKTQFNPETPTRDNAFSTFSLNVSDVSFRLAEAALNSGRLPERQTVRAEEFINAMNYHDPAPGSGERLSFAWEQARDPFAHNRDLIRFSVQTGAIGRSKGKPLNLVVLLDRSGSMERPDRVAIVRNALGALAQKLTSSDRVSLVAFARTPRLVIDGAPGGDPESLVKRVDSLTPQGGTNLDAALDLGYEIAARHFRRDGVNRVILLTDGAANLGDIDPAHLKQKAEAQRKRGVALDCFGVGWDGYNDALLEELSRNADGRYGFLNEPAQASADFAGQLAGALRVAARDVKTQVEFNPARVKSWRQVGYEKRQLKKEDFRNNAVDAAEIGAAETGTAVYSVQIDPKGVGPIGVARVRFQNPDTGQYEERAWTLFHRPQAPALADSSPSMRLAGCAAKFAGWLGGNPWERGVNLSELRTTLAGTEAVFANDPAPARLLSLIARAEMVGGAGDS